MTQARIPEHKIEEVRQAADIVEVVGKRVRLVQAGRSHKGLCPFHGDQDPSLIVNRERGTWHCFGCGEGGNVFSFVMKDEGLSFPEAVRELARRHGVVLPTAELSPEETRREAARQRLLGVLEEAARWFSGQLAAPGGAAARSYLLEKRGLAPETVAEFGLGWAPAGWENLRRHLSSRGIGEELGVAAGLLASRDKGPGSYDRFRERVIFPIHNAGGRVVSFGGRIMGAGEPKYLNGPESSLFQKSKLLYNYHRARPQMFRKGRVLVAEGYFDVITLAAYGFTEAVAPMGTALTADQARRLAGQGAQVFLVFDGDAAGKKAARRSLDLFLAEGVSPRVLLLPNGEDPDSFLRAQGAPALETALAASRPLVEEVLAWILTAGDLDSPEGKSRAVAEAGEVLKALTDPVVRWGHLQSLASQLDLPPEVVAHRLGLPLSTGGRRPALAPAGRAGSLVFSQEACVLELALCSAEAAQVLAEGGALAGLADEGLAQVGQAICELLAAGERPEAARVIARLEPALHSLASQLSQRSPRLEPAAAAQAAADLVRTHRRRQLAAKHALFQKEIAQAERAGDHQRVADLQARRRELCVNLSSH
ncbi:MAG: DNA primase [Deltaproteobacteria bacterium]|nr:DNA primase [Deltaproteobacteria bacterium]